MPLFGFGTREELRALWSSWCGVRRREKMRVEEETLSFAGGIVKKLAFGGR